jgi:hypothetical protein
MMSAITARREWERVSRRVSLHDSQIRGLPTPDSASATRSSGRRHPRAVRPSSRRYDGRPRFRRGDACIHKRVRTSQSLVTHFERRLSTTSGCGLPSGAEMCSDRGGTGTASASCSSRRQLRVTSTSPAGRCTVPEPGISTSPYVSSSATNGSTHVTPSTNTARTAPISRFTGTMARWRLRSSHCARRRSPAACR